MSNDDISASPLPHYRRQERIGCFLDRLMLTRRFSDQLFLKAFGVTAYPYLDILLVGRANGNRVTAKRIIEHLRVSVELANRYLAIMVARKMIEVDGTRFPISKNGQNALHAIFESNSTEVFGVLE